MRNLWAWGFMMSDWLNPRSRIVTEANSGFEDSEVLCREKGRAWKTCEEKNQQLQRMHFCSQRIYIWNFQVCLFLLQWCYKEKIPNGFSWQKTHTHNTQKPSSNRTEVGIMIPWLERLSLYSLRLGRQTLSLLVHTVPVSQGDRMNSAFPCLAIRGGFHLMIGASDSRGDETWRQGAIEWSWVVHWI